jgi:hypothetical protein
MKRTKKATKPARATKARGAARAKRAAGTQAPRPAAAAAGTEANAPGAPKSVIKQLYRDRYREHGGHCGDPSRCGSLRNCPARTASLGCGNSRSAITYGNSATRVSTSAC